MTNVSRLSMLVAAEARISAEPKEEERVFPLWEVRRLVALAMERNHVTSGVLMLRGVEAAEVDAFIRRHTEKR